METRIGTSLEENSKSDIVLRPPPKSLSFPSTSSEIPYADGGSPDREVMTLSSSSQHIEGNMALIPHSSSLTELTNTQQTVQRTLGQFEPIIRPSEAQKNSDEVPEDEANSEKSDENQRLVERIPKQNEKRKPQAKEIHESYEPGSCCYCLAHTPALVLFLWLLMLLTTIGWTVSSWMSLDYLVRVALINIRSHQSFEGLPVADMIIMMIAIGTLVYSTLLVIISSYSSKELSYHHLSSSTLNKLGFCLSITVTLTAFLAIIIWTLIIALTMIPTAALCIIHVLVKTEYASCLHLPSFGYGYSLWRDYQTQVLNTTSPALLQQTLISNSSSYEPTYQLYNDSSLTFTCGEDRYTWIDNSWRLFIPLLFSIGMAFIIEMILMGFLIVSSSNSCYLKTRMSYLSRAAVQITDDKQEAPFL